MREKWEYSCFRRKEGREGIIVSLSIICFDWIFTSPFVIFFSFYNCFFLRLNIPSFSLVSFFRLGIVSIENDLILKVRTNSIILNISLSKCNLSFPEGQKSVYWKYRTHTQEIKLQTLLLSTDLGSIDSMRKMKWTRRHHNISQDVHLFVRISYMKIC